MSYNTIKRKVKIYLTNDESYRDEDNLLVIRYWSDELKAEGIHMEGLLAMQFLNYYAAGYLTPADEIIKAKREIQSKDITLRGDLWLKRTIN
jgi:hypothetical protein